jgi:hypothetical protein
MKPMAVMRSLGSQENEAFPHTGSMIGMIVDILADKTSCYSLMLRSYQLYTNQAEVVLGNVVTCPEAAD